MNEHYVLTVLIIFIAFFGESMFGFGGGLIAIPLLSVFIGVPEAVTLVLMAQFCMGLLIFKTYMHVDKSVVLPMTASLVVGAVIGTFSLSVLNPDILRLVLATLIIIFLIKTYFFSEVAISSRHKSITGRLAGLSGGFISGLIGAGGPPIVMYLRAVIKNKAAMRASLIYAGFVISVVRVAVSASQGLFTPQILQTGVIVLPVFLVAVTLGHMVHHKISETFYIQVINALLLASATILLIKAF